MRFMMMVKGDKDYEAGLPSVPELIEAINKLSEDMTRAGVMLDNGGLMPSVTGARVRASQGKVSVTDGPFTETKELIGGYAIVEAGSRTRGDRTGQTVHGAPRARPRGRVRRRMRGAPDV